MFFQQDFIVHQGDIQSMFEGSNLFGCPISYIHESVVLIARGRRLHFDEKFIYLTDREV